MCHQAPPAQGAPTLPCPNGLIPAIQSLLNNARVEEKRKRVHVAKAPALAFQCLPNFFNAEMRGCDICPEYAFIQQSMIVLCEKRRSVRGGMGIVVNRNKCVLRKRRGMLS